LNAEETGVRPNESDPKVEEAETALDDLHNWLVQAPPEFFEWYRAKYGGAIADLTLRPFWKKHLS
jgi:hypothetical protein